jgi:two-component system phosphate regulon sensor histidine kinase PhoR
VIAADGTVLGESDKPPGEQPAIENHLHRPEVQEAIRTGVGTATRRSQTAHAELLYVAVPVLEGDRLQGVVRVAMPLDQVAQTIARVRRTVALASLVVGLLAVPVVFWMARRTTLPILAMRGVAGRVAAGDFSPHAPVRASGELGELAAALEAMSAQLEARLRDLAGEKAELTAILSSMTEGVLVLDADNKIRLVNDALRQQLQLNEDVIGRTVLEAFRNVALQEFLIEAGRQEPLQTRELAFVIPADRVFEVTAARLRGGDGSAAGVVVVFHDITRIQKLEAIRKDFVANVSHELRTPLSILKGYIETLLDEEPPDAATARQFLQTIQKNSRRLEALIDDLLTISALESQQAKLLAQPVSLTATAQSVTEELAKQARAKSISVAMDIPAQFPPARGDAQRLHQVFSNLLDNAIKYTQPGGRVVVSARHTDGEVEVCVADNGPGIAPEHLPRIFERFYRADKARSRELGGTGLGLSIVKHIVQAHGGRVWAESEPGKGSAFYFTLPRA